MRAREDQGSACVRTVEVVAVLGEADLSADVVVVEVQREGERPMRCRGSQIVAVGPEEAAGTRVVAGDLETLEPSRVEGERSADFGQQSPADRRRQTSEQVRVADDVVDPFLHCRVELLTGLARDAGGGRSGLVPDPDQLVPMRRVEHARNEQGGCLRPDLDRLVAMLRVVQQLGYSGREVGSGDDADYA